MRERFEIYCDILHAGLQQIRMDAHDPQQCLAQAVHLQHIPELLRDPDNEDLQCIYWEANRPWFIEQSKLHHLGQFKHLWEELDESNRGARAAW